MAEDYITRTEHNEFAKRIDEENNRQNHRITLLEANIDEIHNLSKTTERLAVNMENMVKSQNNMNESLKAQGERLGALEKEPAEKWNKIVWVVISVVVTAVLTYIISMVGLK